MIETKTHAEEQHEKAMLWHAAHVAVAKDAEELRRLQRQLEDSTKEMNKHGDALKKSVGRNQDRKLFAVAGDPDEFVLVEWHGGTSEFVTVSLINAEPRR